MAKPDDLGPFLENLHQDFELRPLAEQIIDQVLSQNADRYRIYDEVRGPTPVHESALTTAKTPPATTDVNEAFSIFMQAWIGLEKFVRENAPPWPGRAIRLPSMRILNWLGENETETKEEFERIRRMRNNLVHGVEMPAAPDLLNAAKFLNDLVERLRGAA